MSTKLSDLKALHGKFAIFSRRGWWKISCYECNAEWRLEKDELRIGSLLRLIDHYAGHEMKRNNPEKYERIQAERKATMSEKLREVNQVMNDWMRKQVGA
jgi:hypothetical protein